MKYSPYRFAFFFQHYVKICRCRRLFLVWLHLIVSEPLSVQRLMSPETRITMMDMNENLLTTLPAGRSRGKRVTVSCRKSFLSFLQAQGSKQTPGKQAPAEGDTFFCRFFHIKTDFWHTNSSYFFQSRQKKLALTVCFESFFFNPSGVSFFLGGNGRWEERMRRTTILMVFTC